MINKAKSKINEKGITLVALIITIIILVLLAGISIKFAIDAHIIRISIEGSEKYSKKMMEENEIFRGTEDFLDEALKKLVKVGIINENIKLKTEKTFNEEYTKGTIHVEIEYEGVIESIHINEKEIKVPEKTNGVYIIEDEVTENGMYIVIAKDTNGDYQITNVKVNEILGDMKIYDEEDMELLRERVNEGKVFVSTKVEVMKDITLTKEWEAIGTAERQFLGEFEGNEHSIKGLKIEGKADNQGLFSYNSGVIKNLEIEGTVNSGFQNTGMLVGTNSGTIENVETSGTVQGKNYTGGIVGNSISGSKILNCKNAANINENDYSSSGYVGGIVGNANEVTIENCINEGTAFGSICVGGISGMYGNISNCGNNAKIVATRGFSAGISGRQSTIIGSYNKGAISGNRR